MSLILSGKSSVCPELFIRIILIFIIFDAGTIPLFAQSDRVLPLSDGWYLQSSAQLDKDGKALSGTGVETKEWYPVTVPTTVLAALVKNNVYPDPYYADNLKSIPGYREGRWLAMKKDSPFYPSWWYRREFNVPASWHNEIIILHLDGINYKANIWLNGEQIADTTEVIGMFRRFNFDVSSRLARDKKNVLAVEIFAPGRIADIAYRTKQVEATTGWDDHNPQPPDLNMGLWEDVYLQAGGPVFIEHPYVVTDLDLPALDRAWLTISAELLNRTDQAVEGQLTGKIGGVSFQKKIGLAGGERKTIRFSPAGFKQLIFNNPRLWWPHPVGPQNLYDLDLTFRVNEIESSRKKVRFGIREVSTYINEDGWRGYQINGKNILIRGGAWMTSDMLLRLTDRRYDALVRYAREANLNALRSEGFSIRETDEFYNKCDEYGILVIQQIFGRSIPDEDLAVELIRDMILRIRNHPSLVHFLGHDETFPTDYLDKKYRALIAEYTPERTYQPHSGAFHIEDRFKTGGTRTGTLELWTYATPSHYYTHKEDGAWGFAQSGGIGGIIAPFSSIKKMLPEQARWPLTNDIFSFHTVLQGIEYFDLAITSLEHRYGKPNSIEEFCLKGQVMNYESARGMFEAYGRNKYEALGITTWKYDAAWPAAMTWQYVDWYLNVGGAYYGAKKACEPLHVQYAYDDRAVYVINNFYQSFTDLKVSARIFNIDMQEKFSKTVTIDIGEDEVTKALVVEWPKELSKTYFLYLMLQNSQGKNISENFYWLSTIPDLQGSKEEVITEKGWGILKAEPVSYADFTQLQDLPKVQIQKSYQIYREGKELKAFVRLKNPGKNLAFMIKLSVKKKTGPEEVLPVYWQDNYFSLLPGAEKTVEAAFLTGEDEPWSYQIAVDGWNVE